MKSFCKEKSFDCPITAIVDINVQRISFQKSGKLKKAAKIGTR